MTDPDLPPDLADLERQLTARPRVEPAADLGPRALAAARGARPRPASVIAPAGRWRPWAAVAAALLFGVNLSMSAANNTDWRLSPAIEPGHVAATADQLRALAPDLPEA